MGSRESPIRVLVVDDSPFMRHILVKHLEDDPDITVIDTASDGIEAVEKVVALKPDVVSLDVEMPRMDGLTALRRIMKEQPTPVVMLSALTQQGAQVTIQALMRGAVDFVPKPSAVVDLRGAVKELIGKIKVAVSVQPASLPNLATAPLSPTPTKVGPRPFGRDCHLIVIGASTGGPTALRQVLSDLPADLPAALTIVQHMPAGFTQSLAVRLDKQASFAVQEAMEGDRLACGLALLAPGGFHLRFERRNRVTLDRGPRRNGVRPALDVSMESAATTYGDRVIGVVLTGMGLDGTRGAGHIKASGGRIVAEHKSTCIVYGMPRAVTEAKLADIVVPLPEVASTLVKMVR
jgi:two-component system chemotaxis response regulator CheB